MGPARGQLAGECPLHYHWPRLRHKENMEAQAHRNCQRIQNNMLSLEREPGMVAHTGNPSHSAGRGRRTSREGQPGQLSKTLSQHKKNWGCGSAVVHPWVPERNISRTDRIRKDTGGQRLVTTGTSCLGKAGLTRSVRRCAGPQGVGFPPET